MYSEQYKYFYIGKCISMQYDSSCGFLCLEEICIINDCEIIGSLKDLTKYIELKLNYIWEHSVVVRDPE